MLKGCIVYTYLADGVYHTWTKPIEAPNPEGFREAHPEVKDMFEQITMSFQNGNEVPICAIILRDVTIMPTAKSGERFYDLEYFRQRVIGEELEKLRKVLKKHE